MEIRLNDEKSMGEFRLPEYREIPDVGLYLKQVVKFVNDAVAQYMGVTVTDSMLSNYVKLHMVASPVKKLYYRDHIAVLLFISLAKSVLSLENLDALLKKRTEKYTVEETYTAFKGLLETALESVYSNSGKDEGKDMDDDLRLMSTIATAMSYTCYLNSCFVKTEEEKK